MTYALVVNSTPESGVTTRLTEVDDSFLGTGDLLIDVSYSSVNYKDGMALAANKGVARIMPLVPGIDVVGRVLASEGRSDFAVGDRVLVNGAGLGEFRHGGYIERLRVSSESAIPIPERFTDAEAAALGTAGFTAALSVLALLDAHYDPSSDKPILVTGATGGVGMISLILLHSLGYASAALTGRPERFTDQLRALGATEILPRSELETAGKPLQKGRWSGVIDTVGSTILANAISQTTWGGVITACGLAAGTDLPLTVLPFILRGVKLIGINSVDAPHDMRIRAWDFLAEHINTGTLHSITSSVTLNDVAEVGANLLHGRGCGRTIVDIARTTH